MNARFLKLVSLFCLLSLLTLAFSGADAQDTNSGAITTSAAGIDHPYDIQIENGELLVAPLQGRVDIKAIWGQGDLHSVPATIENLAKYLRAANPDLNIVLSPGAPEVKINDLKLRSSDMRALTEAVGIATDGTVRGSPLSGKDNWTFMVQRRPNQEQTVEVFNLSGYIQTLNTSDDKIIRDKLDELNGLIHQTLVELTVRQKGQYKYSEDPGFKFHAGSNLFIVMCSPDAIDVARKIVNALPGQPRPGVREDLPLDNRLPRNQK